MSPPNDFERVYDAVTTLTAEVRSFMERLVRVETRDEVVSARALRIEQDVAKLQAAQGVQQEAISKQGTDISGIKTKVAIFVTVASTIASLVGAAIVTVIDKVWKP